MVLAGDIFELTRSALWLENGLRPYIHLNDINAGSPMEARIAAILATITQEERVAETLAIFRSLETILQRPVGFHYIPGNHDRLANATPLIRHQVQNLGFALQRCTSVIRWVVAYSARRAIRVGTARLRI